MGKLNEIQQETKQSFGNNSFTTKIAQDAVEFDSAADKFKFLDPIDAPAITINGEQVVPGGGLLPDDNGNYNMGNDNNSFGSSAKNNVTIGAPSSSSVANVNNGSGSLIVGEHNTMTQTAGSSVAIGVDNTISGTKCFVSGEVNNVQSVAGAAIASYSTTVNSEGQYSAAIGCSNTTVGAPNTVALAVRNETCDKENTVYVPNLYNISGREIYRDYNTPGVEYISKKIVTLDRDAYETQSVSLAFPMSSNSSLVLKIAYKLKGGISIDSLSGSIVQDNITLETLTCDGEWHEIWIEPTVKNKQVRFVVENGVQDAGDTFSVICEAYANTTI